MRFLRWIVEEGKSLLWVTLYFAVCFAVIMLLKRLWLAEYGIEFRGITTALFAALVTGKVVIVIEKVPLNRWLRDRLVITEIAARSLLYSVTTLVVLLLEKAIESRAEFGGIVAAVAHVFEHREIHQVWATTLCVSLSFVAYNVFSVVRREIGTTRLVEMLLSTPGLAVRNIEEASL